MFGPFRLDVRAGELRRGDERISLTPKMFQLLLLLVENPGRLIAKREFLETIWGETNVTDGSLTRAITRLRSALHDSASRPEYVETVPRRGYRFVAAVQNLAAGQPASRSSFQVVVGGRCYPLLEGDNVLGRADDCQVCLELASISRHHAVITVEGDRISLRDLRSKNGTFVGGRRIEGSADVSDRQIRLGSVTLRVMSASGDPSTLTETAQRAGRHPKK